MADTAVDDITQRDGVLENQPILDLDLPDAKIIKNLHTRIQNSLDYYNDKANFDLRDQRIKNLRMIKGDQIDEHKLYHYQTPWVDNELYVGVDAIIAYVTARSPRSEVYPAKDAPANKKFAKDLENYHHAHSEKFYLSKKMEAAVLNLLGQRIGLLKLTWDPLYGSNGEIVPKVVNPSHVIIDKNAALDENPAFICHVLKDSVEGLIARFPDKETEIKRLFTIKRKGAINVSREIAYREVWFTYYDKDNKPQEAVAWYVNNLVLDKKKNPNWLYEGEGENFLDNPVKPFIPFNLFNDGAHWVDFTGPVEQAIAPQETLNKEGRQIVDNLGTANGFKVMAAGTMSTDAAQNLNGDPNQTAVVKLKPGQGVNDVITQIKPQIVSEQLIADKEDSRNVIHNMLGTPSQFRGDDNDLAKTASTNIMIKNQASGRQDKIVRAIDYAMDKYFKLLTQMMCVWYTGMHYATVNGGDGNFDYIEMHQDKIESGMTVRVQEGTTLPFDKARQEAVAQNAAELGLLAPYDYFKLMHMENPQKLYDNLVKWKTDPQKLAMDVDNDEADQNAVVDFTELMAGKKVAQRDNPSSEYIEQFRKLMIDDNFLKAKQSTQNKVIAFVSAAARSLDMRTVIEGMSNTPPPPEPLPPQIQETIPQPAPLGGVPEAPGLVTTPGQAMPGSPLGAAPAGPPIPGATLPGIQGVMQLAQQQGGLGAAPPTVTGAPNLNPTQPLPPQGVSSLPPM